VKSLLTRTGDELLLVFDGFDGSPTRGRYARKFATATTSVQYVYDYTSPDFDLASLKRWKKVHLAAWSLGVWQAAMTLANVSLASAAAFNGTLEPVSAKFGIPPEIFRATLANWRASAADKFARRCRIPEEFRDPAADPEKSRAELAALNERILAAPRAKNIYRMAFGGAEDRIFPIASQAKSWAREGVEFVELAAPHFIWNSVEARPWTSS